MTAKLQKSPWIKRAVNWRRFIKKLKPQVKFNAPVRPKQIFIAEKKLGHKLPVDLKNLLLESDGIEDWLLSAEEIASVNLEHRENPLYRKIYTPFEGLLFFLHDGTGSYYAYPVCGGNCDARPEVLYWLNESDERTFAGHTLVHAIQRYLGLPMNSVAWPSLRRIRHLAGRTATPDDVKSGNAAFALSKKSKARVVDVVIPQFAFRVDYVTGEHMPVVLIQAEKIGDSPLFGVRYVRDNSIGICNRQELSLRGTQL